MRARDSSRLPKIIAAVLTAAAVCALGAFAYLVFSTQARAVPTYDYIIIDGDSRTSVNNFTGTARQAVAAAGISTGGAELEVSQDGTVYTVIIRRSPAVTVFCDGQELVLTASGTVADALQKAHITVSETDEIYPAPDTPLSDGLRITLVRVRVEYIYDYDTIPHSTTTRYTDALPAGRSYLSVEGRDGVLTTVTRLVYRQGELISREVVSTGITTEPQEEIILVGTGILPPDPEPEPEPEPEPAHAVTTLQPESVVDHTLRTVTVDETAGTITIDGKTYRYTRVLSMTATAYTYDKERPWNDTTASGVPVQVGVVAAKPATLPQGTKVYITGVKHEKQWDYVVSTVGDKPGSDIIDIFLETEAECFAFGRCPATVYVLEEQD
ncbi:MAG: G5 domain-containing protein [Oscillospiraceae bacterium]|nr:G5 domain-containing protein [Oscillospiraceae bacterium]